jgi:hypothetical protein
MIIMQLALRELRTRLVHPLRLLLWAGATLNCVLAGPFGSDDAFSPVARGVFWGLAIGGAIVLANMFLLTGARIAPRLHPAWRILIESVLFGAILGALLRLVIEVALPDRPLTFAPVWVLAVQSAATYLAVQVIKHLSGTPAEPSTRDAPAFLARLSDHLGQDLLRVSSQDHYVEVRTARGQDMILMRFADALAELDGAGGLRVHRSHWVHPDAVASVDRTGGRVDLILTNGDRVPVSRSFRTAAETAGLI